MGGVAAGIAEHTGSSVGLVRLGFLITALFAGFGVLLYLAAWALVPAEGAERSAAESWLGNLTTPGKRLGAFLIGLAVLVVLAGAAPVTILVAVFLLAAAALLANSGDSPATAPAGSTATADLEETD